MSFTDLNFITRFLPVFFLVFCIVPPRYRTFVLMAGSMVCYGAGDIKRLAFLLVLTAVNFGAVYLISRNKDKRVLAAGITADAAILVFFKYIAESMPLGASFFTFMMISSLVDAYRRDIRDVKPMEYFSYIFMFPKMIQGPVIPLKDVQGPIRRPEVTAEGLLRGIEYFTAGMALKVVIADEIGKLWGSVCTAGFESVSMPLAWLGIAAFSMQLYFDFWGYSVMARGLGMMMGIDIMKNFDHPYSSVSVSEFYRRWHISLGRWFKEYVYIPLGGNRRGKAMHVFNLAVVWLLTGIWHGTGLNFLIWAGVLFILIILEKFVYGQFLEKHRSLGHLYIWFFIPLTWGVFAVEKTSDISALFSRLFPFGNPDALMIADALHYGTDYIWVFILAVLVSVPALGRFFEKHMENKVVIAGTLVLLWICIYLISTGAGNTFMYARF